MKNKNDACGTFIIHNNWNFLYNGKSLVVTQKDLDNYKSLSLSDDDIKLLVYSFLTKESFYDFNETHGNAKVH